MRSNKDQFIKKAIAKHNGFFDYTLVEYKDSRTKVKIICPVHGIFEQIPNSHLMGKGCLKCKRDKARLTTESFIKRAKLVHSDKYDYSETTYISSEFKVKIICPEHNEFFQYPGHHLNGQGCRKCGFNNLRRTTKDFIKDAIQLHGNKYDYSLVDYINKESKVKIICPIHGIFEQSYSTHISQKCGCPKCSKKISIGEKEVLDYIKSIYFGEIITNDRTIISPKEIDILIPDLKIAIEYNGEYWHSKREENSPGYHELKESLCKDKGLKLINISDKEWRADKENIKKLLDKNVNPS